MNGSSVEFTLGTTRRAAQTKPTATSSKSDLAGDGTIAWRSVGDATFTAVIGISFVAQIVGLAALTIAGLLRFSDEIPHSSKWALVIGAIALTTLCLFLLLATTLLDHRIGDWRAVRREANTRTWTQRWRRVLDDEDHIPGAPHPPYAIDAITRLVKETTPPEAIRLRKIMVVAGIEDQLISTLKSGKLDEKLWAIGRIEESLSLGCLDAVLHALADPHERIRIEAARCSAQIAIRIRDHGKRERECIYLLESLVRARLPRGIFTENVMLIAATVPSGVRHLLSRPDLPTRETVAVIEAVRRLKLTELAGPIWRFIGEKNDPEIRAAALRVVADLGVLPPEARWAVLNALDDEVEFVRVQATRALVAFESAEALQKARLQLSDRAWWVRKAAAESLIALGSEGRVVLQQVAIEHPDRYARGMAAQVLGDSEVASSVEVAS